MPRLRRSFALPAPGARLTLPSGVGFDQATRPRGMPRLSGASPYLRRGAPPHLAFWHRILLTGERLPGMPGSDGASPYLRRAPAI